MTRTISPLRRFASLSTLAATFAMLGGCASATPIGELLNNSAKYNGKTVRIKGEVRESAGGFGFGAYQVRDESGTLPVLSQLGSPPRSGTRISVQGRFESLFTLGSKSLAVLRETERKVPQ